LSVSDNFDWVNGGYHPDAAGDNCFCVKSGTTATFDYELFGDENATTNGKEMKLVFKTSNVASPDAVFMHCVDSLIDATDGYPADSGLLSVTVVCDSGLLSDALSTACFILGYEKSLPLLEKYGASAIFVDSDMKISTVGDIDFEY
jgi:hypothetical protein